MEPGSSEKAFKEAFSYVMILLGISGRLYANICLRKAETCSSPYISDSFSIQENCQIRIVCSVVACYYMKPNPFTYTVHNELHIHLQMLTCSFLDSFT